MSSVADWLVYGDWLESVSDFATQVFAVGFAEKSDGGVNIREGLNELFLAWVYGTRVNF